MNLPDATAWNLHSNGGPGRVGRVACGCRSSGASRGGRLIHPSFILESLFSSSLDESGSGFGFCFRLLLVFWLMLKRVGLRYFLVLNRLCYYNHGVILV